MFDKSKSIAEIIENLPMEAVSFILGAIHDSEIQKHLMMRVERESKEN